MQHSGRFRDGTRFSNILVSVTDLFGIDVKRELGLNNEK